MLDEHAITVFDDAGDRTRILDGYAVMDTHPEEAFDELVGLAGQVCGTARAVITLVDESRQFFKAGKWWDGPSVVGLDVGPCPTVVAGRAPVVIHDVRAPGGRPAIPGIGDDVGFYAGVPLTSPEGIVIGAICVLDPTARPGGLTRMQLAALDVVGKQVVTQLEHRRDTRMRDAVLARQAEVIRLQDSIIQVQAAVAERGGDLDGILRSVLHGLLSAVPVAEGGEIEMASGEWVGISADGRDLPGSSEPRRNIPEACLSSDHAVVLHDPSVGGRPTVLAPVRRRGETVGVLRLRAGPAHGFSEHELNAVRVFAAVTATGLSEVAEALARRDARASEDRYRAVFESAGENAVIVMDADGLVTAWNGSATRILGWTAEEMRGGPADVIFTESDRVDGVPGREISDALTFGRAIDERWHLRKDGSTFWASGEMTPLRDATGGFVKFLRDRTGQRLTQDALAAKTELLQTVMDHVGQGVLQMNVRGEITFANPGACAMFGWSADELVGRNLHDTLHHSYPDGRHFPGCECTLVDSLRHGRTLHDVEQTFFHRDGTPRQVLATNAPVMAEGKVRSAVVTVIDVTARMEARARQGGLVELGDRLRDIPDRMSAIRAASEIAATTLNLDRAGYGTFDMRAGAIVVEGDWQREGLASIVGSHPVDGYGTHLYDLVRGEDVVVSDAWNDPRTAPHAKALDAVSCRAFVNLPLMEHGRFTGQFFATKGSVRFWQPEELSFLRSVADRTRAAIARIEAEERQDLLNHEIGHRMKNLLSVVQSIAMQATRESSDVAAVREVLGNRLTALARAHDILLGGSVERASVGTVLRGGVGVMDGGRFSFDGPDVEIGGDAGMALALTVHELSTNAAKYGALSTEGGRVRIDWTQSDNRGVADLCITWREEGGPPVTPPSRKGFGTRLIERGLAGQVGGTVSVEYAPGGVVCVMQGPVEAFAR